MNVALLHPGEMGATVGAALVSCGHRVSWLPAGRSPETGRRAETAGLTPCDDLAELVAGAQAVVSVCPPGAALDVARRVAATGFEGLYVDANAVSPGTARRIAEPFGERYVDGGLIGPPAVNAGTTRLYLSGPRADHVAGWFSGSVLEAAVVDESVTSASALKMCYAAYTKGLSALTINAAALAASTGVTDPLFAEWDRSQPGLTDRAQRSAAGTARKAWRFEAEMLEIAKTFAEAGLPDGFHRGAAEIYRRMVGLKSSGGDLDAVIEAVTGSD